MKNLRPRKGKGLAYGHTQCWVQGEIQSLLLNAAGCQEVGGPGKLGQTPTFASGGIREQGLINDQP